MRPVWALDLHRAKKVETINNSTSLNSGVDCQCVTKLSLNFPVYYLDVIFKSKLVIFIFVKIPSRREVWTRSGGTDFYDIQALFFFFNNTVTTVKFLVGSIDESSRNNLVHMSFTSLSTRSRCTYGRIPTTPEIHASVLSSESHPLLRLLNNFPGEILADYRRRRP